MVVFMNPNKLFRENKTSTCLLKLLLVIFSLKKMMYHLNDTASKMVTSKNRMAHLIKVVVKSGLGNLGIIVVLIPHSSFFFLLSFLQPFYSSPPPLVEGLSVSCRAEKSANPRMRMENNGMDREGKGGGREGKGRKGKKKGM